MYFLILLITFVSIFAHPLTAGEISIPFYRTAVRKSVKSWTEIRDSNVVRQKYDYSCGTASLATMLRYYYKEDVTEKDILKFLLKKIADNAGSMKALENKDFAFSFSDLGAYAKHLGYKPLGIAMPIDTLKKLRVPAVLYLETRGYRHFSVFRGMDNRFVYMADPSFGNRKIRIDRFKKSFYTRDDLEFPGKGLVLIPQVEKGKYGVKSNFMKSGEDSDMVYRVIKNEVIDNASR